MAKVRLLLLALLFATLGPILIGGISGFQWMRSSEEYPSRELAFEYYYSLLRSYPDMDARHDKYRDVGRDGFGQRRQIALSCKEPLPIRQVARIGALEGKEQTWPPVWKAAAVEDSFQVAASSVLKIRYANAAVATLGRSGTLTGLLNGCRQSVLFLACDALGRSIIRADLAEAEAELTEFKQSFTTQRQETACDIISDYSEIYDKAYPQ